MKRILVVDDHPMFRRGLVNTLLQSPLEMSVICDEAGSGEEALPMVGQQMYDLAIVDISMPGMGGMALLEKLRLLTPQLPVLMLSMFSEEQFALSAFRLGAAWYLTKREASDELISAVTQILSGMRYLSRPLAETLIDQAISTPETPPPPHHHVALSKREMEIMKRLASGQRLKHIAAELCLSIKTVSTYKSRIFTKMGFHTTARLINYATTQNLV